MCIVPATPRSGMRNTGNTRNEFTTRPMKIYYLPPEIKSLVFDMDLTLYTHPEYGQYQIDSLIERLGKQRGLPFNEMNAEIKEARKNWALLHNGKKPSLTNILMTYGISMEENILWRKEIYEPERFIREDTRLRSALEMLSLTYALGLVTNNPVLVARKTLAALGVGELFPIIIGLDTCMCAKPHSLPFKKYSELSCCAVNTCVSIGDRYDIDLDIPLEMGMGGILVNGVEDVYELPEVLASYTGK